jgi:hypothetical protein
MTEEKKTYDLTVEEIKNMIVQGKVDLNDIIKSLVRTVSVEKRGRKKNIVENPEEKKKAYYRDYYNKNKARYSEKYKKNREVMNENSKKYYRLKKIKELGAIITSGELAPIEEESAKRSNSVEEIPKL